MRVLADVHRDVRTDIPDVRMDAHPDVLDVRTDVHPDVHINNCKQNCNTANTTPPGGKPEGYGRGRLGGGAATSDE